MWYVSAHFWDTFFDISGFSKQNMWRFQKILFLEISEEIFLAAGVLQERPTQPHHYHGEA